MRVKLLSSLICLGLLLTPLALGQKPATKKTARPRNVLFIAVDDLRPTIGAYGAPIIQTPNLDALARNGTVFTRAYCQQAVCSPSRTSLMTGLRPDSTKIYDLQEHFRLYIPEVITLPQYFKQHGYHAQGLGKIYHGDLDDPQSWSLPHWSPKAPAYANPTTMAHLQKERERLRAEGKSLERTAIKQDPQTGTVLKRANPPHRVNGPSWEASDVPDNTFADGQTADKAIEVLRAVKDKPFFLAVGFIRPHLPFVAPQKYFDLYPPAKIPLAANPTPPTDVPKLALTNWGELRNYSDIPKTGDLAPDKARELVRGYYAATSYMDAQLGRVLAELDRLGLRDNTIIVVWGDHGWQLGEHGMWCKHTNFEIAARAPLILSAPGQKNRGAKSNALVEFVDIYPTLCELADLPIPQGLEGISLAPLQANPRRPWKQAVFNQYPRGKIMGYSMRTDRYRYTEWAEPGQPPVGVELYDHHSDPAENVNLAHRPDYRKIIASLSQQLRAGWRAALPKHLAAERRSEFPVSTDNQGGLKR